MATDWIKMRPILLQHPNVLQMSCALQVDEFSIVGRLLALWGWLDSISTDGTHVKIASAFIDRITCRDGFADALRDIGWLSGRDGDLSFPSYLEHNGTTSKKRAEDAKRQYSKRMRDENRDKCHASTVTNSVTRLDKIREDKNNTPIVPLQGTVRVDSPTASKKEIQKQAEEIYELYPYKAARPKAIAAILKAIQKDGYPMLLQKVEMYAEARKGQNRAYTPLPTTWFNQERYKDDPATWPDRDTMQEQPTQKPRASSCSMPKSEKEKTLDAAAFDMDDINKKMCLDESLKGSPLSDVDRQCVERYLELIGGRKNIPICYKGILARFDAGA